MKNKYIEQLKRSAKLHHQSNQTPGFQNGIIIRHLYDEENPIKLSWWDDVAFVLNDYIVNVAWQHPRNAYKDKVDNLAYDACAHLREPRSPDIFDKSNPNYRRVGKSRKKIASYTMNRARDDGYYDALRTEEKRIARDSKNGIVITPGMTTEWTNWSRFVSICAPIEVRGVKDLHTLANLTKRLLKRETSLDHEFPGYTYNQKDWVVEFQESDVIGIWSHAVNI